MQLASLPQIDVECFIRWSTDPQVVNNDDDWRALKVTKIVKGEAFKYGFRMDCGNVNRYIDQSSAGICLSEIFRQCALQIKNKGAQNCTIVPVPNSNATLTNQKFNTLEHAKEIAKRLDGSFDALPLLLWSVPQNRAHDGGRRRDWREHFENLIVNGSTNKRVILFDDVITSGSQMYASKRKLEAAGFTVVGMMAVVSVLDKDGVTHSEPPGWVTANRMIF